MVVMTRRQRTTTTPISICLFWRWTLVSTTWLLMVMVVLLMMTISSSSATSSSSSAAAFFSFFPKEPQRQVPPKETSNDSTRQRNQHWINDEFFQTETATQLAQQFLDNPNNEAGGDDTNGSIPTVTKIHKNQYGTCVAVEVQCAITTDDVQTIRSLAAIIQSTTTLSSLRRSRNFGKGKGGNDCTYLAPLLQKYCPSIIEKVVTVANLAYDAASWDRLAYPSPFTLGIRTSEHLSYQNNGQWEYLQPHKDIGSIYTIMIALVDPTEYEGGEFYVIPDSQQSPNVLSSSIDISPSLCQATVFLSETLHGVRPILGPVGGKGNDKGGGRITFVTELWEYDDSPLFMCRPTIEEWNDKFKSTKQKKKKKTRDTNPFLRNSDLTNSIQSLTMQNKPKKTKRKRNKKTNEMK